MRQFIKSGKNKTLSDQQFRKPQDIKREALDIKYIIYSAEDCFESRLHNQLPKVMYRRFPQ
jgi:hypothetical protein